MLIMSVCMVSVSYMNDTVVCGMEDLMNKKQVLNRLVTLILFIIYVAFLFYFLFFSENYGRTNTARGYRYNLIPFTEIKRYIIYHRSFKLSQIVINLLGNIVAFMPMGFFFSCFFNRKVFTVIICGALSSVLVELIQLITMVGSFDVDDIILNTLGVILGCIMYYIVKCRKNKK